MKFSFNVQKSHQALLGFIIILFVASCAPVVPIDACVSDEPFGFWAGLWHGIIAPFTFFVSLLSDSVAIYAINNNGGWYDFGFVIGAGIIFGGSGKASKR
ncbi:MAG: hypothetical protein U5K79_23340 [Cyclobacteriaceae bacterium]|nr:hypothetical protein [Cyclobacteriaceae bacterium]